MQATSGGITKRDILIFLFKWKGTIFGWALFTIVLVAALTYALSQPYQATAKVIVERNRAPTLRTSVAYDGLESIEVMNNEIEIIHSRPVMSAVVEELRPHERPSSDSASRRFSEAVKQWLDETGLLNSLGEREAWIQRLLRAVKPESIVNSNVLEISYQDEDPVWAAEVVNAVTDQYIRRHLEIFSSKGATEFYRERLEAAEAELERLRRATRDYKQRGSISAVADRRAQLVRELTAVRADLADARTQRAELVTRFQPGHTSVLLASRRVVSLVAAEKRIQEQLEALEEQESELEPLEMRTRTQETLVLDLKREYEQARLTAASTAEVINVRLVEYAEVPARPRFPRLLFILLSIPLSFLVSLSVALLREYLDHRAADPDTAEAALGLSCLGSIPRYRWWSRHRLT